VKPAGH